MTFSSCTRSAMRDDTCLLSLHIRYLFLSLSFFPLRSLSLLSCTVVIIYVAMTVLVVARRRYTTPLM